MKEEPFRVFKNNRLNEVFWQFFRFGIVGFSNTILGYLIYVGSLSLFKALGWFPGFDYNIAQAMDFLLTVPWSFYWNNRMVFGKTITKKSEILLGLLKSYAMYCSTGLVLSEILLVVWVRYCGISEYIAALVNLLITIPLNFVLSKIWVFRSKKKEQRPEEPLQREE
ncbi:MAG: GtrA family protein [Lachnospiraceae bacterium]|nr:GtrA family protein [Lachnospiraceae bacterium]